LVEDVALEFTALGRFPGTFIKFLIEEIPLEIVCRMLDGLSRKAVGKCAFGYYDGQTMKFFEGRIDGEIADHPAGEGGFGWDKIFIPEGYGGATRAELDEDDYKEVYLRIRPLRDLKAFLEK
jgi:non-canonical purine NTP pyrophosphatase (RdgB/HAM1 family)